MSALSGLDFVKVEGLGNDFIILGGPGQSAPDVDAGRGKTLCDRRLGVGADGVILLSRSETADVRMQVINSDGSRPEMCGNGLRCVVAHLGRPGVGLTVETDAGLRQGRVEEDGRVWTDMGRLRRTHAEIDLEPSLKAVGWSAGNPHMLVFAEVDQLEALADEFGEAWTRHPAFPSGVNVGFWGAEQAGWRGLVHERGAGRTLACGTGAAAAAAEIMRRRQKTSGRLRLLLPGGVLEARVEGEGDEAQVALVGQARRVFQGRCFASDDQRL